MENIWASQATLAVVLDVKRRSLRDLRRLPGFPEGRLIGGQLRFHVPTVLAWVEAQPAAKWSRSGGRREHAFVGKEKDIEGPDASGGHRPGAFGRSEQ